ncbi:hypothetical protein [Ideonella sp. A 288]|uniref:hypothetical protein n=1 Tax=Ideonella sp. A 288 TaxID=1962181 RepID=UPI000B4AB692|nr:hypothetical protein [Ideonella sp. A 288]
MNTIAFHPEIQVPQLVDFVDFKWLMASEGHRIDVARLQRDADYGRQCLVLALATRSTVLHRLAQRLLGSAAA